MFFLEGAACWSCSGARDDCAYPQSDLFKGTNVTCGEKKDDFGKTHFCTVSF